MKERCGRRRRRRRQPATWQRYRRRPESERRWSMPGASWKPACWQHATRLHCCRRISGTSRERHPAAGSRCAALGFVAGVQKGLGSAGQCARKLPTPRCSRPAAIQMPDRLSHQHLRCRRKQK